MTPKILPLLLLILLARNADAQTTVGGVAVDSRLKRPLPCVTVRLLGPDSVPRASTRASATGRFAFTPRDTGAYLLRFEAWGFYPVTTGVQRIVPGERSARMYGMWLYPIVDTLDVVRSRTLIPETQPEWIRTEDPVPELLLERVGDVFARFAVDSAGRVDTSSIVMIRADSPDMDTMTRRYLARSVWTPGRVGDRPVCALVGQSFVFDFRR
jgi:hypothetical protein